MFLLKVVLYTALFIELATILVRFVFKVSSKEVYVKIMRKFRLKKFYHFHHLFLGVIVALIFYSFEQDFLFNIGLGIVSSDLIHHFIVLWLIMGNPEFHVVYKDIGIFKEQSAIERRRIKIVVDHLIKEVGTIDFYPSILEDIASTNKKIGHKKATTHSISRQFTKCLPKKHFSRKRVSKKR